MAGSVGLNMSKSTSKFFSISLSGYLVPGILALSLVNFVPSKSSSEYIHCYGYSISLGSSLVNPDPVKTFESVTADSLGLVMDGLSGFCGDLVLRGEGILVVVEFFWD